MPAYPADVVRWRYAETGKRAEFIAAFQALEELGDVRNGRYHPRFEPERVVAALETALAFRTRSVGILVQQLCHLVRAAACLAPAGPNAWLGLLLALPSPMFGDVVRRALTRAAAPHAVPEVALGAEALELRYQGGETYCLFWNRTPLLLALLELLVTTSVGEPLVRRLELLAEAPWRRGEVDRAAAELQAIVDVYLDEVLRPRQQIAKFSRLFEFLERTSPDDLLHFTDATLLGFWREAAERPEDYADFKLFRTAFLFFCDVHSAMLEGESMLARDASLRLGPNREAGEIDVGDAAAAEPGECWRSPLEHFAQAPLGDSKILNETERRQLQLLLAAGPVALTHVRSLLRAEVMGGVQEKLAKGRLPRDTDGAARLARLVTLAVLDEPGETDEPARNYIVQAQRYANLAEHVRRVLKIAGLVRWRARAEDDNPIMIAELETGLRAAERLLLRVSRAGFKEALTTPKAAAPFLAALDPLLAVDRLLTGLGNALTRLGADGGLDAALAADRPPFAEAFQLLYGKPT